MVRETRHLWVGNLPDNIREDRIREHFKRYGRVQSVKLLPRGAKEETSEGTMACTVAFMDIKSASKAHNAEHKIDERTLTTEYYEPAAIPSAASPQNTPSSYSTSPGSTRFPNGHGSSDEHGNFSERFYDRTNNRVSDSEYIRRTGYHDNNRGRNRDRGYRNGPYTNMLDRSHRLNSTWSYDTSRYNNQNSDTGYSTAPSENNERRTEQSTKKKTKSRSGSRSPSPSGSTSSRSPSRSRSRSSSSSSSSSTSRASSSTGSPKSRRVTTNAQYQPVVHSEDRRPLAICVRNLPCRSSDTSLKDGLFHEYKKHGKVTWVKVVGQSSERHAIVCFKKPEDVEKALEVSYDKLFFGSKIEVAPYQGYDVEDNDLRPYEAEIDEFHPKATRTLFIGNLEKDVTASDLRKHFDQFGEIIEIDIKKQGAVSSYAFCQYSDIVSVVKAIRAMDGEHLGTNRIKLGFGKSMPTGCVWVDGVAETISEKYLINQFEVFGSITQVNIDREKGQALIFYEQVINAQTAVNKMRGMTLKGRKIQVDFASRECQEAFYEHLGKEGHTAERGVTFEERRDSSTRNFDNVTTATRFSRYDTPTRPRTSSYSSRSSAAASQCNTAVPSPGTPGSVTPRGTGSRTGSRLNRYDYYENTEYTERHFRSYDEYSQGSAASHEDVYEHEYYHESPSHTDTIERLPTADHPTQFPLPDIKNLQKERVHLLEQLEECPSSGDELISPKKKLKLEHLDGGIISDVIIETNRDHRKVTEVRRLSDACVKHHSRRPSIDGKHSRDVGHDRSTYLPHAVCKRRKTGGSDSGSRVHHYDQSGSESVGGSRPGTPLCDERPEHFPTEPRRTPRDREGPLTLPLPRFAAQVLHKGSISVAGIKGQKDNVLSSPPPAVTSPRITNPKPPSPVHVPPPASPPPRPPSLSSNSSDSDNAPPSPSLDERIRSLDEKYEKWSGSRALSAAGGDALAKLDANRDKFKFRHKLLDLDLKEVQPSEIVKSVMAKRSVFDEDTKRLENVGEKYEPKEFSLFPKTSTTVQTSVPVTPLSAPPVLKVSTTQLPKTPTMLSPRSAGTGITPAKGLQYPFPTHPPLQTITTTTSVTTTPLSTSVTSSTTTTSTTRASHGDNRLKPCASASSDNRTSSKVNVNRSVTNVAVSNIIKTSDTKSNIPTANSDSCGSASLSVNTTVESTPKSGKSSRDSKASEKVSGRRDSSSSNDSRSRRNSDTSARKSDDPEKLNENCDSSEQKERDRIEKARVEHERLEREKLEKERLEKERLEKERADREREEKEKQRAEKERLEKERLERERLERERAEKERLEKERLEHERLEKERLERERQENERLEKERQKREREERERKEREREERERKEREERERKEKEREERERREKEREERERKEREDRERKEREEKERKEREEQLERDRLERERRERKEREEKERREKEEHERREKEEHERLEKERLEKEKERRRERDEERKHKEDNHDKRKDEHRHRENHCEKHGKESVTENKIDRHDNKNTKEDKKDNHDISKKEHDSRNHESRELKNKHHSDRDTERRKDSVKENRENNAYEKLKNIVNEIKEHKDRLMLETRHLSIDLEKNRQIDSLSRLDPNRRKERNNSLPANVGAKRRSSAHDNPEGLDEPKKLKLIQDHKKLQERRDSKDGREDKQKTKHKSLTSSKVHDDKIRPEKYNNGRENSEEKRKDKERDKDERHKNRLQKSDKQKMKSKSRDKESRESPGTPKSPGKELITEKEFLSRLDFTEQKQRKEIKEKRKADIEMEDRKSDENKRSSDEQRRKDKMQSSERKTREETKNAEDRKSQRKDRIRKMTHSSDNTDSDEPKKHSIFDIVDDEPAYISMYDKVKARSCKNMQKQEEEKRQEKIKAKFSQLKQSRAKREEKKRSTSWDEDSDSDRNEIKDSKTRRGNKMLIASSDEEENSRKTHKKRDIFSDSESRQIKSEQVDTSDEDRIIKTASLQRKGSKSRITSDTSDDEFKKVSKVKSEVFSDNEDIQPAFDYGETLIKKIKEELDENKYIKKEKKNVKHQELIVDLNTQIFGDVSSAEENIERKEKSEGRKKHKKKQKRQKNSVSSEDSIKLEVVLDTMQIENYEKLKSSDKKKQHSKKDKKRDRCKDEEKMREKSKKSKKNKSENKRDGKMENIFGSLSDDSENGIKEQSNSELKQNSFLEHIGDDNLHSVSAYVSDSDSISQVEKETHKNEEKERHSKEEHRKRKEKKRREKEKRMREEINENSIDFVDLGKQLEENIKDDSSEYLTDVRNDGLEIKLEPNSDTCRFLDINNLHETKKEDRKENREKKKKRKKSKEEKQRHHHHHHHHDKNKIKSPEFKKDIPALSTPKPEAGVKIEPEESEANVLNISSPLSSKTSNMDTPISPLTRETIISPTMKTSATTKDKKRDKFIPGFGSEIDEKIHESAVKSISEFEQPKQETKDLDETALKEEKVEAPEEKPRVVISQEETEDAVAALLGESFGSGQFDDCCYNEQQLSPLNNDQVTNISEENVQDDEEMRQAVQSLNSSELEMKPDTPQSEHELQIDTDTEEQEEISLRYDQPPKTPDTEELAHPPKTPDIPNYFHCDDQKTTVVVKTANIGSPPSLTPIKPQTIDNTKNRRKSCSSSLPLLPEQKSVISQSWSVNETKKSEEIKPEVVQKIEDKLPPLTIQTPQNHPTKAMANLPCYKSMPVLKMNDSSASQNVDSQEHLKPLHLEQALKTQPVLQPAKPPTPGALHNVPPHIPYPVPLQKQTESGKSSPKVFTAQMNRLPITSVMVSKPLQSTTLVLPQGKAAQGLEPPKLVSTQDRNRMIYHSTANISQFTGYVQSPLQRNLPTQGLVMPSKVPPTSYASLCLTLKGNPIVDKQRPTSELPKLVPTSPNQNLTQGNFPEASPPLQVPPPSSIIISSHSVPKSTPVSNNTTATSNASPLPASLVTPVAAPVKSFMPVIQETPKLVAINSVTDLRTSVPTIIQQAPPKIQTPPTPPNKEPNKLENVSKDNTRISTASPVIVSLAKETKQEPPTPPAPIQTEAIQEPAKPLAIEKVTEELNLSLKKDNVEVTQCDDDKSQEQLEVNTKTIVTKEEVVEIKQEPIENETSVKTEPETPSVIKEVEKFDEEKAETESIVSDMSKERLSTELSSKDDPLDSKEDSDYWSAKEVNIDSVIKKVDALCSADELSDRSSEIGKDDWYEENKTETPNKQEKQEVEPMQITEDKPSPDQIVPLESTKNYDDVLENNEEKESTPRSGRRGGRPRGSRKSRGVDRVGVQTRRGKVAKETALAKRGGRTGRPKSERKITKSECETDIYEFRDDSDDAANKDRPRLILTIKPVQTNSANGSTQQTAIVKEVMKVGTVTQPKIVETKEEFASPVTNTRKSKRLQEKDTSRNTVDDTIEDVVKNTVMVTRSSTAAAQGLGPRRSARQTAAKTAAETPRKSPRASKKKDRRASETTDDSSEEKIAKVDAIAKLDTEVKPEVSKPPVQEESKEKVEIKEKPHEGLKAAVLRRVKGEMNQEPMSLIDPVTGLLTPMRECEEGKYIPVSGASGTTVVAITNTAVTTKVEEATSAVQKAGEETKPMVQQPQSAVVVKQQKPQSLKAHVLSSQAAKAVVSQIQVQKPVTLSQTSQPTYNTTKGNVPISQNLNVNVSLPTYAAPHLSPRTTIAAKSLHNMKLVQPPLSPSQMVVLNHQPKQVLQVKPNVVPKTQVVNPMQAGLAQMSHMKQTSMVKQPVGKQSPVVKQPNQPPLLLNKAIIGKHGLHQQQMIPGSVASFVSNMNRMPQTTASMKPLMDPPKVEVSMAGCAMVPRSNSSPQSQPRHVLQAGMPVPAYEASLGEPMGAHFPPGPLRPDLHYMHPSHVIYQQYIRPYHLPRSPIVSGALEKPGDGQEGEEAPVTSPPLELRRPGSVGLALSGRANAVPHSLQSPHDRTTDSPQVGQVYNMHSARMQHYHPGRYFEEPPPAHRPVTSHGSLAALGSERPLTHMGPLGTPDRPLSAHSGVGHMGGLGTPDRPLSTLPDRPLSGHSLALGAGLGAAGNLMGAVARHIGADAPATQRGVQAATPPHASQVPPQAESLLMLLKQYPCMWQGLLALKNDQAAVQMYFVSGNDAVAKCSLPKNTDGSTPPLRIFQRMRLEPPQVEGVARKMQMENEHCMLLALPCGHDHMDVLKQSTNLNNGFITYLQQKQAAGIVNVAAPGTTQPPAYVVHIFPSCDFVNENLRRIAPSLLERVADIAHLLIVITTV